MSRASEREAARKAQEILKRAGKSGDAYGDEYGAGQLTRAQKKSQEKHIPLTPAPKTRWERFKRDMI
jgi:hypothetical protein